VITAVPVTARLSWQYAAIAAAADARPLLAALPGPHGLEAFALLACRDENGTLALTIPRAGSDDAWELNARTPKARHAIAALLAAMITGAGRPWRLEITGLLDQETAELLASLLPGAKVQDAPAVPCVRFQGTDTGAEPRWTLTADGGMS